MSSLKCFFSAICMYLRGNLRIRHLFGHPTQGSTLVQLAATCDFLRVSLARALIPRTPVIQTKAINSLCSLCFSS